MSFRHSTSVVLVCALAFVAAACGQSEEGGVRTHGNGTIAGADLDESMDSDAALQLNGWNNAGAAMGANSFLIRNAANGHNLMVSNNRVYRLVLQDDCNVVIYHRGVGPIWATNTSRACSAASFWNQGDGNVVLYVQGVAVWSSGTWWAGASTLIMQDDGNLVQYNAAGQPVWASGTNGR